MQLQLIIQMVMDEIILMVMDKMDDRQSTLTHEIRIMSLTSMMVVLRNGGLRRLIIKIKNRMVMVVCSLVWVRNTSTTRIRAWFRFTLRRVIHLPTTSL